MNSDLDPVGLFRRRQFGKFAVFGAILLAAIGTLFALYFLVRREAGAVLRTRTERAQILAGLESIADLARNEKRASEVLARLIYALPTAFKVSTETTPRLYSLARVRQLQFEFKLGTARPLEEEGLSAVDFSLKADGLLGNIIDFLSDLESEKTVIGVSKWEIRSMETLGKFQLELSGAVYARGESEGEKELLSPGAQPPAVEKAGASFPSAPAAEGKLPTLKILPTELGYLRVRFSPSATADIAGKVLPGETYSYSEKKDDWYKIILSGGGNGWVSGKYIELLKQ